MIHKTTHIRFAKAQEKIILGLVEKGVFRTKAEAVRAGVLLLGEKYGTLGGFENE
jgi:Arc/MetJ-type ribon-helix-helix transcriptional regulator